MIYINIYGDIYWGSLWCPTENLYFDISRAPGSFAHIFESDTLWCPKQAPQRNFGHASDCIYIKKAPQLP